jgi:hypothetical protein
MGETPAYGPVETAFRAWVTTLGALSPRQTAEAEVLYRLAAEMDLKTERPAAAYGTLRRAITATANELRDAKNLSHGQSPVPSNVVPPDAVEAARLSRSQRRGEVS